jgi:hypothetical protein
MAYFIHSVSWTSTNSLKNLKESWSKTHTHKLAFLISLIETLSWSTNLRFLQAIQHAIILNKLQYFQFASSLFHGSWFPIVIVSFLRQMAAQFHIPSYSYFPCHVTLHNNILRNAGTWSLHWTFKVIKLVACVAIINNDVSRSFAKTQLKMTL